MNVIRPVLHHVTLKTSRMQAMIDWYKLVLGAQVQFQDANAAWMTNDDANHRVAFLTTPYLEDDPQKRGHNGIHHSAYEYECFEDLMSSFERLRAEGVEPAFALDHGLTLSLYYKDPEGNYVELQSDNFGDWAQSGEFMRTSADFAGNPIGTFFDPAAVSQARSDGRSFSELQPLIRAGAFKPPTTPDIGLPLEPA